MYADPKLIHKHRQPMYLNYYQQEKLDRIAASTGGEKAAIARALFDKKLEEVFHALESETRRGKERVLLQSLLSA